MDVDVTRWSAHWAFAGYEPWLARLAAASSSGASASSSLASSSSSSSSSSSWAAAQLQTILDTDVRFETQRGRLRAGLDASDVDGSYADRCVDGVVPTRSDNLHDLLNALVWARFPQAKRALSARQVALARARAPSSSSSLRVRTREQDSCAMVDEGGMVLGTTTQAVFGHAALEDAVLGRDLRPFLIHVDGDDLDAALAAVFRADAPLPRVRERQSVLADRR